MLSSFKCIDNDVLVSNSFEKEMGLDRKRKNEKRARERVSKVEFKHDILTYSDTS
jgi:hypothetical protein